MGKTITPTNVIEIDGCTPFAWRGRVPTKEKLEKFVMEYVVSTMPGFINERIGEIEGIRIPGYARVRRNVPGSPALVEWRAPLFILLPDPKDYPNVAKSVRLSRQTNRGVA